MMSDNRSKTMGIEEEEAPNAENETQKMRNKDYLQIEKDTKKRWYVINIDN